MIAQDRLNHDVDNGILRHAAYLLEYGGATGPERAKSLADMRANLRDSIINELRIRWTLVERPRKQRTLRQEA